MSRMENLFVVSLIFVLFGTYTAGYSNCVDLTVAHATLGVIVSIVGAIGLGISTRDLRRRE